MVVEPRSNIINSAIVIRPATTRDVPEILGIIEPLVSKRVLLGKEKVSLYEDIQEFVVAQIQGRLIGCGALHVFWEDIGEVRTLAVIESHRKSGIGSSLLTALELRARNLGLKRLFCLTFEVDFFSRNAFLEVEDTHVDPEVYSELVRSPDEGVAEFLNLSRVKPNTLGNSRMLKIISQ